MDSAVEDVPATKADVPETNDEPADTTMKNGEDQVDDDDDDDEDPETFVVEAIKDHRSDFEDGAMRYYVKWKGYEKKSDRTWETEDNLEGAKEVLEAYWKSIGGKPVPDEPKSVTKKRGRQSTGGKKPDQAKRPKMSKTSSGKGRGRKSGGVSEPEQDGSPVPLMGYTDEGDDDWKAPPAKDGAWDPLVQAVDTVTRENADGELWGYLIWNAKNEDGRFYRSKAKLPVIYRACPQRMLHFYEKHLVFSSTVPDAGTDTPAKEEEAAE